MPTRINKPEISVIMPVLNEEKYLKESIESILNQSFTNFEFIIVDDNSTDNSLKIIQNYNKDQRVKIIHNNTRIGLVKSLNNALKQARGEYIARQDADDISLPSRLEEQLRFFEKHPKTALLGTGIYLINDENGETLEKVILPPYPSKSLHKANNFIHGSVMFKREVVVKLGGYNELFKNSEDYELWLRIAKWYNMNNLTIPLYKLRLHKHSISSIRTREQALYALLARKSAKKDLEEDVWNVIRSDGVSGLYPYLRKKERISFHKAVAYQYIQSNDLKSAKKECLKIRKLSPFDLENNLNMLLLCFGESVIDKAYNIYRVVRSFYFRAISGVRK